LVDTCHEAQPDVLVDLVLDGDVNFDGDGDLDGDGCSGVACFAAQDHVAVAVKVHVAD
jgi:hypothetical protein